MRPATVSEVRQVIEAAILAGGSGRLSRAADVAMAGMCAGVIAERIEAAGLLVLIAEGR